MLVSSADLPGHRVPDRAAGHGIDLGDLPGPGPPMGSCSRRISSRCTGTVTCSHSVTMCLRSRTRPTGRDSVRTRSCSSERVIARGRASDRKRPGLGESRSRLLQSGCRRRWVRDLKAALAPSRRGAEREGGAGDADGAAHNFGRFAVLADPHGNPVGLWA